MGAANFYTEATGSTAAEAFRDATDAAAYEYGHGGYTGTIAEKHSYIEYAPPAGITAQQVEDAALACWDERGGPEWLPQRIARAYDDKYGPAIAIRTGPATWVFMGMASE
jgi:hypothetical protein